MSNISSERKITYYIGLGMVILGFILFISLFFSVASFMNNPTRLFGMERGPSFMPAILGMVLMISGSVVMNIGAKGAAGSGIILDPEKAREDLKPYSKAAGGMINDVISNIDTVNKSINSKEVIKIRCRSCGSLNDEDAKYCKSCGEKM